MRILATADIHSPKYLSKFSTLIHNTSSELHNIDVILIAGDLMEKGSLAGLKMLIESIRKVTSAPIIACPGNEDYEEAVRKAMSEIKDLKWLNDEETILEFGSRKITIIGSTGVLDRPTQWQLKNIKNIHEIYRKRLEYLINRIENVNENMINILLVHYAPTYKTLEGENSRIWRMLGTEKLEKYLMNKKLLVIHGHAHKSKRRVIMLGKSIILNASFPDKFSIYVVEYADNSIKLTEYNIDGHRAEITPLRASSSSIFDYV